MIYATFQVITSRCTWYSLMMSHEGPKHVGDHLEHGSPNFHGKWSLTLLCAGMLKNNSK